MKKENFETILSKNRIVREMKRLYAEKNEKVPECILFDFAEIEKAIGTANQPTAYEIFSTDKDV